MQAAHVCTQLAGLHTELRAEAIIMVSGCPQVIWAIEKRFCTAELLMFTELSEKWRAKLTGFILAS